MNSMTGGQYGSVCKKRGDVNSMTGGQYGSVFKECDV